MRVDKYQVQVQLTIELSQVGHDSAAQEVEGFLRNTIAAWGRVGYSLPKLVAIECSAKEVS